MLVNSQHINATIKIQLIFPISSHCATSTRWGEFKMDNYIQTGTLCSFEWFIF